MQMRHPEKVQTSLNTALSCVDEIFRITEVAVAYFNIEFNIV